MGQMQQKIATKEAVKSAIKSKETANTEGTKASGGDFKQGYKK